jgi:hypothetical protein
MTPTQIRLLTLTAVALVAGLAIIPTALAAKPSEGFWVGEVRAPHPGPPARISFKITGGETPKLKSLGVTIFNCQGQLNGGGKFGTVKVSNSRFTNTSHGTSTDTNAEVTVEVKGKFTAKTAASGTINATFDDTPGVPGSGCTVKLDWEAHGGDEGGGGGPR